MIPAPIMKVIAEMIIVKPYRDPVSRYSRYRKRLAPTATAGILNSQCFQANSFAGFMSVYA